MLGTNAILSNKSDTDNELFHKNLCKLRASGDDDDYFGCTRSLVKWKCISLSLAEKIKHTAAIFNYYRITYLTPYILSII